MTQPRNILDLNKRKQQIAARWVAQQKQPARTARATLEARHRGSRVRRWKLRALAVPFMLFLAMGAAYGISEASYLPRFTISTVRVVGTTALPERLVRAYVESALNDGSRPYISNQTLFTYHPDQLAAGVASFFPRIRAAKVERDAALSAHGITVTVEERQPFARWCRKQTAPPEVASSTDAIPMSDDCFLMDDGGFIYTSVAHAGATAVEMPYVFSGGLDLSRSIVGQRYAQAHLPDMLALIGGLQAAGFSPRGASQRGSEDFIILFDDEFTVLASFDQSVSDLTKNLKLVLSSAPLADRRGDLEYIDMRFGDRVYYRFKGEAAATGTTARQ